VSDLVLFDGSRVPDGVALDDLTSSRSWSELADRATRIGHLLRDDLGVGRGGHAAVVLGNRVEHLELSLGALVGGTWLTPVSWHLTEAEVRYVLDDAGASVVVTEPRYEAVVRAAAGDRTVLVVGDELDAAVAAADDEPFDLDGPPGGPMFYTSGTTGHPKGVRRARPDTLGGQLQALVGSGRAFGLDGSGPHLVAGPLHHAAPAGFALMDLLAGAPVTLLPRWHEAQALDLIEARGIRATHLVPTMFVRLLRLPEARRATFDASSLQVVLHGAAPVAPDVKRRMIEWWGPVLLEYWGASEGGVVTLATSEDWLSHPGTVGRPIRHREVIVADAEGRPVPVGEQGVLWCRHPGIERVFEYHHAPEATALAHQLGGGAYSLGDIGHVDGDGFVYLADRASNTIISGGVNIYPAEVEAVLCTHPAVADAAVFGVPDDEWGEAVKAVVELVDGATEVDLEADVLAHARQHLAAYKVPRTVAVTDELPRSPSGKLLTRKLRDPYWADRPRSI
jgi:long-chain acyl-CoA synthetase